MRTLLSVIALVSGCGDAAAPQAPPSAPGPPSPPAAAPPPPAPTSFAAHVAQFDDGQLIECSDLVLTLRPTPPRLVPQEEADRLGEAFLAPMLAPPPAKRGRRQASTPDAVRLQRGCGEQFAARTALGTCVRPSVDITSGARREGSPVAGMVADDLAVFFSGTSRWYTPEILEDDVAMRECIEGGEWTELDRDSPEAHRILLQARSREAREELERLRGR